ncbi:MAG: UDP-N-acetylglucosamine--dolichyl-phosphate N-acetylglucosaminephosphotransferase [Candidatus Odinarchaeia archaeon]
MIQIFDIGTTIFLASEFAIALILVMFTIPKAAEKLKSAGLKGTELHRVGKVELAESLGLIVGLSTIMIVICFSWLILPSAVNLIYVALMVVLIALLLGFIDDILNIRWRYKILIPLFASFPLIFNYTGSTSVTIPFIGVILPLGPVYTFIIIPLITIYMSNSINIYAGINLIEVGQSLVLSVVILILGIVTANLLALSLVLPFIGGSLALSYYNKFPAKVFVGNSYTYFAGTLLITIAVLANMEKVLILCTLPQLINFLMSLKDFKGKIPRHRAPKFNPKTGLVEDSGNHTLLNWILRKFGPKKESELAYICIGLQIIVAIVILAIWFIFPF